MPNFNKPHDSMRGYLAYYLHKEMEANKDIWLVYADLGYKQWDAIIEDFPDRCINCGAAEQAGMGLCIGLALEGKIPFFYSITNFSLYRTFEWVRNYVDYEQIPVKILGAGRDKTYENDGYTHQSEDCKQVLKCFPNITSYFPDDKEDIEKLLHTIINNNKPVFISLTK